MTGLAGNSEVEGKQNSLLPAGPVIKCFVTPPNSKMEKKRLLIFICQMIFFIWRIQAKHSPDGHEITLDVYSGTFLSFYLWHLAKLWLHDRCTTRSQEIVWAICIRVSKNNLNDLGNAYNWRHFPHFLSHGFTQTPISFYSGTKWRQDSELLITKKEKYQL